MHGPLNVKFELKLKEQ